MKFYILVISLFFFSCIEQVDSEQNNVAQLVQYINTYGEAMDLDLTNDHMVVAANYQGFIVYELTRDSYGSIVAIDSVYNDSVLDDSMGDNRAQEIVISKNHNIAFITDIYDRIWMHKLNQDAIQYLDYYLEDCFGGTWLSTTIDDSTNLDKINVYSLVKHSSSQNDEEGTIGDFDQYSTSVVWKGLTDINDSDLFAELNSTPSCEFSYNFGVLPEKIFYNDGFLIVSNGELGVNILTQINQSQCFDSNSFEVIDVFEPTGNVDFDRVSCENPTFDTQNPGLGGIYEPEGGFHPTIHSSIDFPGEVKSLYYKDSILMVGLSTSNGCYISLLGANGNIIDNLSLANGYSINSISEDSGVIALSAGHDGVLLYQWDGNLSINYLGHIDTPFSNNVKIDGNNVLISTEDGVFVYTLN